MKTLARHLCLPLALALATGCVPTPTGGTKPTLNGTVAQPDAPLSGGTPVTSAGNLVANGGGNLVSNNGANLIGKVKAPAQLISDKGLGIISNGGGNIVGNNGGNLRLLATVEQVPVANRPAHLKNAAGVVLESTTTDAQGNYAFKSALPEQNLIVEVELAGGKGVVQAIAPKGAKQADADLVSTLTTGYILDRFVRGQADPIATLAKLPADVERDTRAKAEAAFAGGTAAVPATLTPETVVATVDALRRRDATFDLQMEAVKRLLIPAGLSDLGEGALATEVDLGTIDSLVVGSEGRLYIGSASQSRVWRLDKDGRLRAAAGTGVNTVRWALPDDPNPDGPPEALAEILNRPADQVPLYGVGSLNVASDGSILFRDHLTTTFTFYQGPREFSARLMRINPDGTVTKLVHGHNYYGIWSTGAGEAQTFQRTGDAINLVQLRDGQPQNVLRTLDGAASTAFANGEAYARDTEGRFYVHSYDYGTTGIQRLDPSSGRLERLMSLTAETNTQTYLAPTGHIFSHHPARQEVDVRRPNGSKMTVLASVPAELATWTLEAATLAPDGSYYLVFDDADSAVSSRIYHVAGGQAALIAGKASRSTGGVASTALKPDTVAADPTGGVYMAEPDFGRIVHVDAAGKVTVVVGGGTNEGNLNGVPGDQAKLSKPERLAVSAKGELYFLDERESGPNRGVFKRGTDGRLSEVAIPGPNQAYSEFALAPDGTLHLIRTDKVHTPVDPETAGTGTFTTINGVYMREETFLFLEIRKNGASTSHPLDSTLWNASYTLGEDGKSYLYMYGALLGWSAEEGVTVLMENVTNDPAFTSGKNRLAVDRAGRIYLTRGRSLYFAENDSQILRIDPVTKTVVPIAGKGATYLNGTGVDDGLNGPQSPVFDREGNLLVVDSINRQVKRIPKDKL